MDELEALALANITLPQTDRLGELDTLARLDRYGRFDIGGPLEGRVGTLDRVYDFMPWRSLERFKAAAKPTITPDLMGGVKVGITDPYGVALEATDLLGLGLDVGDIARIGGRAIAPAARRVESMLLAPRTPMTSQFGAVGKKGMLPMDEASRMARADQMFPTPAYHGTTHDIIEFDGFRANPESDWGPATYTSTSIDDVNPNYAGEGPDLTNRIQLRAERLADEMGLDYDDPKVIAKAKSELKGGSEGSVYPLRINTEKYATIGGNKPTYIEMPDYRSQAADEIRRADYADEWDYEDAITERADELMNDDWESPLVTIRDSLMEIAGDYDEAAVNTIVDEVWPEMVDGSLTAQRLDDIIRSNISIIEDDMGNALGGGAATAKVLKDLGFEGIIDKTVNSKFGAKGTNMAGINEKTAHIITFPGFEKNIRSKFAKFDPAKKNSANILAGTAAGAIGLRGLLEEHGN